ncbi:MAG: GH92 family glycosyl hydrolase [Bacteroidales bacterium]|nr:GH92 family glycosyl hydrolase [Bacteroidales bacterium]
MKSRLSLCAIVASIVAFAAAACTDRSQESLSDYALPIVGTAFTGHTFPAAIRPFGMVSPGPDTGLGDWTHCSGYHYDDNSILGFSQTHMSGTGCPDMCDLMLIPVTGGPKWEPGTAGDPESGYRSRFSHENETASPGFYSVLLDDYGIRCEVTTTDRCPFYRFSYPQGANAGLLFDMTHGNDHATIAGEVRCDGDKAVQGFRHSRGFINDHVQYFYAEFSEAMTGSESSGEGEGQAGTKLYVSFPEGKTILVKVGVSTVSEEAAKANLQAEIPDWDFDKVRADAKRVWDDALSMIQAKFGSEEEKQVFYTALYHSLIVPNLITDVDGGYRGWDKQEHKSPCGKLFTNYSLWDTYRALHPLLDLIAPERNVAFVNSMLERYKQIGSVPINEYGTCETYCMIGYHALPVISEAILLDLEGFDKELAFEAMKAITEDRDRGVGYYIDYGYIPCDLEKESVSQTLEYAFDDWCLAQAARKLGKDKEAETYLKRASCWRNLYDPSTGFMRGKMADGSWRTPFNPDFMTHEFMNIADYTEGNAWQYTFYVPHEIEEYVALAGGKEAFAAKLDEFFTRPVKAEDNTVGDVTGLIGQYAQGNEPSHQAAYMFNYVGKPYRTQELVSRIKNELFSSAPDGLCGNDDCGQMSTWYIFSALGFYPVAPCSGELVIGSPSVKEAVLTLGNGKTFTVLAPEASRENCYIQEAKLNGKAIDKPVISVEDVLSGGTLEFTMGPDPNPEWGSI